MNCQNFANAWNDWLDQDSADPPFPDPSGTELEALTHHAEQCASCREFHENQLQFARCLSAWVRDQRSRSVSTEFSTRLVQVLLREQRVHSRQPVARRGLLSFAAAAAVLAVIGGGLAWWSPWRTQLDRGRIAQAPSLAASSAEAQRLERAVAQATKATLELALLSTEPAARVSRSVFWSSAQMTDSPLHLTDTLSLPTDPVLSSLEGVGGQISQTVEPISGSARQAFGFLWPIAKPTPNPNPPGPPRHESDLPKRSS